MGRPPKENKASGVLSWKFDESFIEFYKKVYEADRETDETQAAYIRRIIRLRAKKHGIVERPKHP